MRLGEWMEKEVREQAGVLQKQAPRYLDSIKSQLTEQRPEMIVVAARGSSDHAALYLRYLTEIHLGIPVLLSAPSVLTQHGKKIRLPKSLVIGISQSGKSPDVVSVVREAREQGHATLAITNKGDSDLAKASEAIVELGVGEERSVAATKTYSASIAVAYQLVVVLGGEVPDIEQSLPTEDWVDECFAFAEAEAEALVSAKALLSLGRGYSYASAREAALKLIECALLPCNAYSMADFEHGPRALAAPDSAAIVFGDVPPVLHASGCKIVQTNLGREPGVALREAALLQTLALFAARARGLDPDNPRNLQKVTETL